MFQYRGYAYLGEQSRTLRAVRPLAATLRGARRKPPPAGREVGKRLGLLRRSGRAETARPIDKRASDAGLAELALLQNLTALNLEGTRVTDAGLKSLSKLKRLTRLHLGGTRIGDAGLKQIGQLDQLTWLSLRETKMTDAGLKELMRLTRLKYLNVAYTPVTSEGAKN